MTLKTAGTATTSTLAALVQGSNFSAVDAALLRANIKYDGVNGSVVLPGAYEFQGGNGLLYVPRRGVLQVFPGDYVCYDAQGWPILVSANSIAGTGWSHS
jgi:hypothetical protein